MPGETAEIRYLDIVQKQWPEKNGQDMRPEIRYESKGKIKEGSEARFKSLESLLQ